MMRRIIASSVKFRLLVLGIAAGMMFLGVTQLRKMPVEVTPDFRPTTVEVQTEALGLSAEEVEQLVTVPLEQELFNGLPWLEVIRSRSVPGLSNIELIFESGTPILNARQVVQERLTAAHALPSVSKPPQMLQPTSSANRVMMVGLTSKRVSPIEMSVLARWTIRPRLLGVRGVASVSIWGLRERQLQVLVDPERLQKKNVTLTQIIEATGNAMWVSPLTFLEASTPGTGGFFDTHDQRIQIQHTFPISKPADLAKVPVELRNGKPLLLGDVSTVVQDHQPLIGDAVVNDGPGLMLVIEKFPGTSTLDVTRDVDEALDALKPALPGVNLDTGVYRPARYVHTAINNLGLVLLIGLGLLLVALSFVFFHWRTALIALATIPLSLITAALVLYLRGISLNAMVAAGLVIAIGIIVDDAIATAENIVRRVREARAKDPGAHLGSLILGAATEVRGPMMYATLIVLLAVLPVLFMQFVPGSFFRPLAESYALAILASMVVAMTVTPAMTVFLLTRQPRHSREPAPGRALQRGYERVLSPIARHPGRALAALAVLTLAGASMAPFLGKARLPSFKERDLVVQLTGAAGTSLPEMNRIATKASSDLRATPGVRSAGAHVGRAILGDQVVNVNSSEVWLSIDPKADYDATVAGIRKVVTGYPGITSNVLTFSRQRINEESVGGNRASAFDTPILVRLYGEDLGILRTKAEEMKKVLSGIRGIANPRVESIAVEPTLEVKVDFAKAERAGVKPGDVRRAAATLLEGLQVGDLFEEQKVFEVIVTGTPAVRHSVTSIRNLLIDTPSGGHARLGEVAEVVLKPNPNVIKHENISRRLDVGANVRGRSVGAVTHDVEQAIRKIDYPIEYHAELLGDYAQQQAARTRVMGIAAAAAVAIFLLLQAAFGSWRLATLFTLALPSALAGGVLVAFVGRNSFPLGALIGLFTVFGLAIRSGILLVRRYQNLEDEAGKRLSTDLIVRGASERLAPTLMTAVATALAFLPLLVAGPVEGNEVVYPMAAIALGGLATATLLNLFFLPALYTRFAPTRRPEAAIFEFEPAVFATAGAGDGHNGGPAGNGEAEKHRAISIEDDEEQEVISLEPKERVSAPEGRDGSPFDPDKGA